MTLFWGRYEGSWEPQGGQRKAWRDLAPGDLIALRRAIWRVREIREVPLSDWDEHDRDYYQRARGAASRKPGSPWGATSEQEWRLHPLNLTLSPVSGGKRIRMKVRPYASLHAAWVLHPHYPVCAACGEPWPCREIDITLETERAAREMAELEAILPGCCWGCKQPITARQKSIQFAGDNLLLPGAPGPVFHLRRHKGCLSEAIRYERRWVPALDGRHWRLSCPGMLTIHVDGPECTEDPLCPGTGAQHGTFSNHGSMIRDGIRFGNRCLRCSDALAQMGREDIAEAMWPEAGESR